MIVRLREDLQAAKKVMCCGYGDSFGWGRGVLVALLKHWRFHMTDNMGACMQALTAESNANAVTVSKLNSEMQATKKVPSNSMCLCVCVAFTCWAGRGTVQLHHDNCVCPRVRV